MKIKKLKLIILIVLVVSFLGFISYAHAADPEPTATTNSCESTGEFFGGTLNCYLQNVYLWSIGIAGLLAIIMLMYAGYQYASSQGNPEQINQAKEIIIGALAGLVLLIIAALVVQSLGLTSSDQPSNTSTGGTTTTTSTTTVSGTTQDLAKQILQSNKINLSIQDQSRINSSAKQNITDTANKQCAKRDDGSCVTLSSKMLSAINAAAQNGYNLQINWIAGGEHTSDSYHYCGSAVDIYPSGNYDTLNNFFKKYGTVESLHEYPGTNNEHYHFAWPCGS